MNATALLSVPVPTRREPLPKRIRLAHLPVRNAAFDIAGGVMSGAKRS
jgi:hypothetical protein